MKTILLVTNLILSTALFVQLTTTLPIPIEKIDTQQKIVRDALIYLKAPKKDIPELTNAVLLASKQINISPLLIIALIDTESNFKKNAVSNKNYKGLMQTPTATMQYIDVDILHGVKILGDGEIKMPVTVKIACSKRAKHKIEKAGGKVE